MFKMYKSMSHFGDFSESWNITLLHLEVASTVQCTTPKTKGKEKDATKGACAATW